ncbi:uncharacterized protein VDAG_01739 [Verticillium dahliae VdLs.17]|uniref:Uncharacterized protein n=1 Tax=Verticillium dahliae (strain VdLs.17 / ATCC MYA-4575 / FGSC 10137) TaxID=498257 RepID=G2WVV3_VERDV|nr:uncharacterized protein VDAG_01739 [Verticillium dahliae VdLs.17]EGY19723.1 hypothetical protein VDAG_01739 [Verticillium dahliae VdLs.17]
MARQKNKKRVRAKDRVASSETWSADAQQGPTRELTQPSPTTTTVPPHHRNSRPRMEDITHLDAYLEYMQISHPNGSLMTSTTSKAIKNRHLRHNEIRQLIRAVDNKLTGATTDQNAPWSPSRVAIPPTYATAESTSTTVTHAADWAGVVDPSVYGTIGCKVQYRPPKKKPPVAVRPLDMDGVALSTIAYSSAMLPYFRGIGVGDFWTLTFVYGRFERSWRVVL